MINLLELKTSCILIDGHEVVISMEELKAFIDVIDKARLYIETANMRNMSALENALSKFSDGD